MGQEGTKSASYGKVIAHIAQDFSRLLKHDFELVRAESQEVLPKLARHLLVVSAALFVMAISVLPLVAFLVIGLGRLLGDSYWLSSLLIGLLGLSGAGTAAYAFWKKIRAEDLDLPASKKAIRESASVIRNQVHGFRAPDTEERSVV